MNRIVPAVIPKSLDALRETLSLVKPFTREVQVDVVDGTFVPFTSWPYLPGASISDLALFTPTFTIEVDLMIMNPEEVIPAYRQAGVRKVVVHRESTNNLDRIFTQRKELGFELGLSVSNDTPLSSITEHIGNIDYVQLMGIAEIGSQGQPFDERVLSRISELRTLYPNLTISIDGSVNHETLPRLIRSGASRCVAGSAILGAADPKVVYDTFTKRFDAQ